MSEEEKAILNSNDWGKCIGIITKYWDTEKGIKEHFLNKANNEIK